MLSSVSSEFSRARQVMQCTTLAGMSSPHSGQGPPCQAPFTPLNSSDILEPLELMISPHMFCRRTPSVRHSATASGMHGHSGALSDAQPSILEIRWKNQQNMRNVAGFVPKPGGARPGLYKCTMVVGSFSSGGRRWWIETNSGGRYLNCDVLSAAAGPCAEYFPRQIAARFVIGLDYG